MEDTGIVRKLAAILAADVVAYSRLMGADEIGTLNALKALRRELVDPAIAGHRGRIVKTTGDGLLVEFASVVDAVGAAVAVQRGMVSRNRGIAPERAIVFRIGINVGDIIIDGNDIFGDGVNVASRLESLCEPGGICISRSANEQVRDKLSLAFADLGEQTVKNIARAVGVFGLAASDIAALPEPGLPLAADMRAPAKAATRGGSRRAIWIAIAALVVLALLGWRASRQPVAPAPEPPAAALPLPAAGADTERLFWESVRNSSDPAELRSYLARYPDGSFTDLARARLAKLAAPAPPPPALPPPPLELHPPAAPEAGGAPQLLATLRSFEIADAEGAVKSYFADADEPARALAVSRGRRSFWRIVNRNGEAAEEMALERCQVAYGEPCVLVASGNRLEERPAGGWLAQDMPRVRYAGPFDPGQVPAVSAESRGNPYLARYASARGPKAMALHAGGRAFWELGDSQRAVEEKALKACNEAPGRITRSVPCWLYAVGDAVVLPERLGAAKTP